MTVQLNVKKKGVFNFFTLIPVFVASFTAARRLSYLGLNDTVNAQSIIRPEKNNAVKVMILRM